MTSQGRKIPFDWVPKYKKSPMHKEFLDYLKQFDWNEMARQHHGDLDV